MKERKSVYLFWGEEWYLKNKELSRLIQEIPAEMRDFNLDQYDEQTVTFAELAEAVYTLPIMSDKRVVVLKNSKILGTGGKGKSGITEEQLVDIINNISPTTWLIIMAEGKVDKRKKIYKTLTQQGEVKEFNRLKGKQLGSWLDEEFREKGKRLSNEAAQLMVQHYANSLSQLFLEVDKLCSYVGEREVVDKDDVVKLLIGVNQETVFQFIDAVAEKNGKKALKSLGMMLDEKEPPLKILFLLSRQFRLIMQVKSLIEEGHSPKSLASSLRQPPFVVQNCLKQGQKYTKEELEMIFKLLLAADNGIKTGKYSPRLALELLVARLVG